MLVLSRKEEESILIPNLGVTIKVLQVQGKRIKLAIDAPKAIPIQRTECADAPDRSRTASRSWPVKG